MGVQAGFQAGLNGNNNDRYQRFYAVGHDLFLSGAVTSHGGNLSEYAAETITITKRDSMIGRLYPTDLVTTSLAPHEKNDAQASRELVVHRAIYQALYDAGLLPKRAAIAHTHSPHTIFRSMFTEEITPIDSEGSFTFGGSIPVVHVAQKVGSKEAADKIAALMVAQAQAGKPQLVVLGGHGPFALAQTLEGAMRLVSVLELSCRLLTLCEQTGKDPSSRLS